MSDTSDDQLDRVLADWADHRSVGAEELASLQQRIGQRLADGEPPNVEMPAVVPISTGRGWRSMGAGLATAAVLLIAFGTWRHFVLQRGVNDPGQLALSDIGPDAQVSPDVSWPSHIERQSRLLVEFQEVFDENVTWIAETGGRTDMGQPQPRSTAPPVQGTYVTIRLRLLARPVEQKQWSCVQTFDVLARREELVQLPSAIAQNAPLTIWAYPIDKDMIAVDLRYQPAALPGVQIETSNIQRVGQCANIHSFEQNGVEYRLYQTADLLANNDFG